MLPILRVIPVGGVLLAIAILILALEPPGASRVHLPPGLAPARGPLILREQHPEWRQFITQAALRRADELKRLRDLPDTSLRGAPPEAPAAKPEPAPSVAAVPANPADAGPDDATGSIAQQPDGSLQVDIGEPSSAELPVIPHEERPPVITPGRAKDQQKGSALPEPTAPPAKKPAVRVHRKPQAKPADQGHFSLLEALFGGAKAPAAQPGVAAPRPIQ